MILVPLTKNRMLYHQSKLGQEQVFLGMSLGKPVPALASTGGILQTERENLNIRLTDDEIEKMSREKYKTLVEKCIQSEGVKYLCGLAAPHSKSDFIVNDKLEKKAYFSDRRFSKEDVQILFS